MGFYNITSHIEHEPRSDSKDSGDESSDSESTDNSSEDQVRNRILLIFTEIVIFYHQIYKNLLTFCWGIEPKVSIEGMLLAQEYLWEVIVEH